MDNLVLSIFLGIVVVAIIFVIISVVKGKK